MKRSVVLVVILITSVLTTGCFGGGEGEADVGFSQQAFQNFTISVPENWRKIFSEDFANTVPEETVALFVNKVEGNDFIQNLNVIKESLNTDASSLEYAKANLLLGSKALVDYRPIATAEATVGEVSTVLHQFRARNATTEPLRHYTQSYFSRDRVGYTVTCIAEDEDAVQQQLCSTVVQSFRFL